MQPLCIYIFYFVAFIIDFAYSEGKPQPHPHKIEKIQWPTSHFEGKTNNTQLNNANKSYDADQDQLTLKKKQTLHEKDDETHDIKKVYHFHGLNKDPKKRLIKHGSHTHTVEEAEKDGGYIISILFGVMLLAQVLLYAWKKYYPNSFQNVTLFGLWMIPFAWSAFSMFWFFLSVWTLFSILTLFVIHRARRVPLRPRTPRMVYYWFFLVYKGCYATAAIGYLMIMCEFFGLDNLLPEYGKPVLPLGIRLLFYGLYFGVLGRDCAVLCASRMASTLGYKSKDDCLPTKQLASGTCAICDTQLPKGKSDPLSGDEKIFTLNCGHKFHESCIRGWVIVGKKDTCPYCSEHVRLQDVFNSPWEKHSIAWSVVLDSLRYLIVFNPIICIMMQMALYVLY